MNIFKLIKEDFSMPKQKDPAYRSCVELVFNYPGVWAVVNYRFAHFFYQKGFKKIARIISGISQFFTGVDLHPGAHLGRRIFIDHASGVVIGETSIIGDDVLIYQGVTLGGTSLDKNTKRHPTIEDGVIIGSGAKILGNITIGKNAKIGSNAVVLKDVEPNLTAIGIPAYIKEFQISQKERIQKLEERIKFLEEKLNKEDK
ncbi:serine O-acetyltransferase [Campylobacter sp. RKI_CA19_01121]|uniref:serine O-acetyltransferase n=1 Tax=Campylobacter sp. RKI_CA19_01121 TaxID=2911626 RepID=UPI0021E73C62|nr:serine O-acetyltransferase [Campylobacter sp. RKI_CA19_01121]MCV3337198.1 serine O-acetyltransferase [Campylobacter sp. RKI_CA19_01121]